MKKLLFIFVMPFLLTSCEIHYTEKWAYDVHWWVIAIPAVIICITACHISGNIISKYLYVCPNCGHEFYPNKWKAAFSIHIDDKRVFRCPKCGRKGLCRKR